MPTPSIKTALAAVGVTLSSLGLDRVASIDTETKRTLRATAGTDAIAARRLADLMRRIADSIDDAVRAAGEAPLEVAAPAQAPATWRVMSSCRATNAKKDGSTFHLRIGTGYDAKDGSIGVYLDAVPFGHRLTLRRGE